MKRKTVFAVYSGDMLELPTEKTKCHICECEILPGMQRLCFGSLHNDNKHSGSLRWCVICKTCGLKVVDLFSHTKTSDTKTVAQQSQDSSKEQTAPC